MRCPDSEGVSSAVVWADPDNCELSSGRACCASLLCSFKSTFTVPGISVEVHTVLDPVWLSKELAVATELVLLVLGREVVIGSRRNSRECEGVMLGVSSRVCSCRLVGILSWDELEWRGSGDSWWTGREEAAPAIAGRVLGVVVSPWYTCGCELFSSERIVWSSAVVPLLV